MTTKIETLKHDPKIIIPLWIEALFSGEWIQHEGGLISFRQDSYCCLGVLCKIAGYSDQEISDSDNEVHLDLDEGALEDIMSKTFMARCTEMNDSLDYNFEDIGEEIKAKFEKDGHLQ